MSQEPVPDGEPAIQLNLKLPKSFLWILLGAVLGNLDKAGPVLDTLGRMLQ